MAECVLVPEGDHGLIVSVSMIDDDNCAVVGGPPDDTRLNHGSIDCTVCVGSEPLSISGDNEHDDEHDNENILTLDEEDDVYRPYGFWIGSPKGPNEFRVPQPPPMSVHSVSVRPTDPAQAGVRRSPPPTSCHSFSPPMRARPAGEGRRGSETGLRALPEYQGTTRNSPSDTAYR